MLDFNQEHRIADLSAIKTKLEKTKQFGKMMTCGAIISSMIFFCGCSVPTKDKNDANEVIDVEDVAAASAVVIEDGNALIVDIMDEDNSQYPTLTDGGWNYIIRLATGEKFYAPVEKTIIVSGEDYHKKAETIAESLIGENGKITCYSEVKEYGKTR